MQTFPFSAVFQLAMVVFYCYLMAFQVRKNRKFKFLPQVVLFIFILCGACFKCKCKSVSLGCKATGITRFAFCASNKRMRFLLTRNSGNTAQADSAVSWSLPAMRTFYQSPPVGSRLREKNRALVPPTRSAGPSAPVGPWALAVGRSGEPPGAGSAVLALGPHSSPLPSLSLTGSIVPSDFTYK